MDFPILTALVVIPAVSALIVALLPARRPEVVRLFGLLAATLTGALSIALLVNFDRDTSGFQFVSLHEWIPEFGISWHLGVDGISLFLVVLTGVLFPIALFGVDAKQNYKAYTAWMLLLEAGCIGTFLSLDLFLFFVCFEIVLVPMYFIIGQWGHGDRVYAATKFFLFTMLGSAFMLVGIIATAILHQRGVGGDFTFNVVAIAEDPGIAQSTARWLFLAFAVAFAVKVPLFPVHTWLPDAHTNAPTAGSVILAAVMLKLGTYGFIRFGLYLFPEATVYFAPLMVTLGVIGITYGAIVATMQRDLKRLVAYSSVAHLGFIILGTFALTTAEPHRRRRPDDQPWALDRRALLARRDDLRAPPHPRDREAQRAAEGRADPGGVLHGGDALVDRLAGAERLRRRVSDPARLVRRCSLVGRRRGDRRDPRRALPALGLPTRLPR